MTGGPVCIQDSAFVVPAFAVEYETQFPEYVTISGGAYFEVNTSLGQITFICPNNYKNNKYKAMERHYFATSKTSNSKEKNIDISAD